MDCDHPILISVVLTECISKSLKQINTDILIKFYNTNKTIFSATYIEDDAALNEVIKVDGAWAIAVKLLHQHDDDAIGESVAKGDKGLSQLLLVNVARVVSVKGAEAILPVSHVLPQSAKLLKVDWATVFSVEHSYDKKINLNKVEKK